MGEVVPLHDDGHVPALTPGQQLFAAIVDELDALGMRMPRSAIAVAARHGRMALDDGVDPDCVLIGCIVALRQGKGRFTHDYIAEVVAVKSGNHLSRREYEQLLESHKSSSNKRVTAERNLLTRVLGDPNQA